MVYETQRMEREWWGGFSNAGAVHLVGLSVDATILVPIFVKNAVNSGIKQVHISPLTPKLHHPVPLVFCC